MKTKKVYVKVELEVPVNASPTKVAELIERCIGIGMNEVDSLANLRVVVVAGDDTL